MKQKEKLDNLVRNNETQPLYDTGIWKYERTSYGIGYLSVVQPIKECWRELREWDKKNENWVKLIAL